MNEINEMNTKLARIKKSCHVGAIVSSVFCVLCIVGCVLSLVGAIAIFTQRADLEPQIENYRAEGKLETVTDRFSYVDLDSFDEWHSDVPALQNIIDEYPLSFALSAYIGIASVVTAVAAVLMKLVSSAFKMIENSDTPFDDKVIRRVMIVMIALTAVLLMTTGAGYGVLCGLATWVIYNILDYGKTLQTQSDETL